MPADNGSRSVNEDMGQGGSAQRGGEGDARDGEVREQQSAHVHDPWEKLSTPKKDGQDGAAAGSTSGEEAWGDWRGTEWSDCRWWSSWSWSGSNSWGKSPWEEVNRDYSAPPTWHGLENLELHLAILKSWDQRTAFKTEARAERIIESFRIELQAKFKSIRHQVDESDGIQKVIDHLKLLSGERPGDK
eukprot:9494809-Pyramimonas_sp.AAC.1